MFVVAIVHQGEDIIACLRGKLKRYRLDSRTQSFWYAKKSFDRAWAGDYLLSMRHRIKYFQLPKSGSKLMRTVMMRWFGVPYNATPEMRRLPGNTLPENRVHPKNMPMDVASFFTFTFLDDPVKRFIGGYLQIHKPPKPIVIQKAIEQMLDLKPGAKTFNVHLAPQASLLMDMFEAESPPRLDFVGKTDAPIEDLRALVNNYHHWAEDHRLHYQSTNLPQSFMTSQHFQKKYLNESIYYEGIASTVLCRLANALHVDYQCLPVQDHQWCR